MRTQPASESKGQRARGRVMDRHSRVRSRSGSHSPVIRKRRTRSKERRVKHRRKTSSSPTSSESNGRSRRHKKRNRQSESRSTSRSYSPDDRKRRHAHKRMGKKKRSGRDSRSTSFSPRRLDSPRRTSHAGRSSTSKHSKEKVQQLQEEKRKQKEVMKALETPEEKRARRLKKKQEKERRRREKMGWDKKDLDYTNADNPFGDHHLLDKFVWHKKREVESTGKQMSKEELERSEKLKQEELRRELQKVKMRRLEREKEREAREEEAVLLQRLREAEQFEQWEAQEDQFHLEQAKLRSKIRIESGRANPIDLLAKYANMTEEDMDIEIQEPYNLLKGLNVADLEDLLEDIEVYRTIEKDTNLEFWRDIMVVCKEEIEKLKKMERTERGESGADRRGGINESVTSEVSSVFKGKDYDELVHLETKIKSKITGAGSGTDVGYWESLLQQLNAHMARARLKAKHQAMLRRKLWQLKQEQAEEFGAAGTPLFPSAEGIKTEAEESGIVEEEKISQGGDETQERNQLAAPEEEASSSAGIADTKAQEPETLIAEEDLLEQAFLDYESGRYSPKLFKNIDVSEEMVVTAEEDSARRAANRERVLSGETLVSDYTEIEMQRKVDADGMATEEYNFNSEVAVEHQDLLWKEKYRPRKPRFLNRVHTGFEWNKYNQTHYDTDNPPPKIVQGYKFNIFFPDLIDKRKTPTYSVKPCEDNKDFAILRFHGGPPYEDIAFKIVNREWEYSWKHGFKSQFNNNILQLWFRFKRNRYRR